MPIGHADGIGRQYGGGKTTVLIKEKMAPIIGNVCMDMIMIDVTGIDCREGDEVTILEEIIPRKILPAQPTPFSYEILTAISQRVTRKIKK